MRWLLVASVAMAAFIAGSVYAASNDAVSVGSGIRFICQTSAPSPAGRARAWVRCSDGHVIFTTSANVDVDLSSGNSGYATIKDEGSAVTQRTTLNFTGDGVSCVDNSGSTRTDCTIAGSQAFDYSTWAQYHPDTASSAGNLTVGHLFRVSRASTCTAVAGYWAGPATTIRVRIYNAAGTSLGTGTSAVSGAGHFQISLSASVPLSASTSYWATMYDTGGTNYTAVITAFGPEGDSVPSHVGALGPVALTFIDNAYGTGDVVPSSSIGTQWFSAQPVYTTP
jgi:hypothetical protein